MIADDQNVIAEKESAVRGYARLFPTVFNCATGSLLSDTSGREYIDFFCGAGTLNYGHNHPASKQALLDYIEADGIQHGLDTMTQAKASFIRTFDEIILQPRGLNYKLQFTGPTGTNAVEAAIKLARKLKQRNHIIAFTHGYHGHSLGALALTGNSYYHSEFYGSRNNVSHLPYDGYLGETVDTADYLAKVLTDPSSGTPKPAAIILETVQGEGGINVASTRWLQKVEALCREHDVLLIVDDIQVGNGRTGTFFSFEQAQLRPDLVCLSKSLGGGLPMSLLLIDPACDAWQPGEHTGTFRGNNLAFVAATALLQLWKDPEFESAIGVRADLAYTALQQIVDAHPNEALQVRGRGMILGLDVGQGAIARQIIDRCFADGLLIESSGADDEVLKFMGALNIPEAHLRRGMQILQDAVAAVLDQPV